jgi:2-polyprenyl-3-methyl-5-hydroxy-6-metoxy-1,4-benzoquinol methylase
MLSEELKFPDPVGFETLDVISTADQFNKWMYETIAPFIKGDVLELGSGIGNISSFLIKNFDNVTLSDYNLYYCQYLKEKYSSQQNLKAVYSIDLQKENFEDQYKSLKGSFDSIILLNVIEHLKKDSKAIENCHFLLKKNGNLIILAPAFKGLYSRLDKKLGHYRRYTKKTLFSIFNLEHFTILKLQYFNFLGFGGWLVLNKFFGREKLDAVSMKNFDHLVPLAKVLDKMVGNKIGLSAIVFAQKL